MITLNRLMITWVYCALLCINIFMANCYASSPQAVNLQAINPPTYTKPSALNPIAVPRLQNFDIDFHTLARWTQAGQILLLHNPQSYSDNLSLRFVSSFITLDASIDEINKTLRDFEHYPDFMPQVVSTDVTQRPPDGVDVDFRLGFKLPIGHLGIEYSLAYQSISQHEMIWQLIDGDMTYNTGRWELIPLNSNQTLLIYTSWTDLQSISPLISALFRLQPELALSTPISANAVTANAFKQQILNTTVSTQTQTQTQTMNSVTNHSNDPVNNSPDHSINLSINQSLNQAIINAQALTSLQEDEGAAPSINQFGSQEFVHRLTTLGTFVFVHEPHVIEINGEQVDIIYVTASRILPGPTALNRQITTQFERYPELLSLAQSSSAEQSFTDNGFLVDWKLKLGVGLFSIKLNYQVEYQWDKNQSLSFRVVNGDLPYLRGRYEWTPIEVDKTLFTYTVGNPLGKTSPALLKLGKLIPNQQIVSGTVSAVTLVESASTWLGLSQALTYE